MCCILMFNLENMGASKAVVAYWCYIMQIPPLPSINMDAAKCQTGRLVKNTNIISEMSATLQYMNTKL